MNWFGVIMVKGREERRKFIIFICLRSFIKVVTNKIGRLKLIAINVS